MTIVAPFHRHVPPATGFLLRSGVLVLMVYQWVLVTGGLADPSMALSGDVKCDSLKLPAITYRYIPEDLKKARGPLGPPIDVSGDGLLAGEPSTMNGSIYMLG